MRPGENRREHRGKYNRVNIHCVSPDYRRKCDAAEKAYTPDEIRNMEESARIRVESEPVKLIEMVREIQKHFNEKDVIRLPQSLKQKLINELVEVLRVVNASTNTTLQHVMMDQGLTYTVKVWQQCEYFTALLLILKSGLDNVFNLIAFHFLFDEQKLFNTGGSTSYRSENDFQRILARAMESNWAELLDEIGLWIPVSIINNEHNDKPEGEDDFDDKILAGRWPPPECNVELHTDYGGQAVRWGLYP
ncbi:hypothetical protein Tco_1236152 [Tanacetum coccineum]